MNRIRREFLDFGRTIADEIPDVTEGASILEIDAAPEKNEIQRLVHHYLIWRDPALSQSLILPAPENSSEKEVELNHRLIHRLITKYGAQIIRNLSEDFTTKIYLHYLTNRRVPSIPEVRREAYADWFHVDAFNKVQSARAKGSIVAVTNKMSALGHQVTSQKMGIGSLCAVLSWESSFRNDPRIKRLLKALDTAPILQTPELRQDSWSLRKAARDFSAQKRNDIHDASIEGALTPGFVLDVDIHQGDLYIFHDGLLAHGRSAHAKGSALFID